MEWILYIIGGFILIAFLWGIGFIPEFLGMIGMMLFTGLVSGIVAAIFSWGFEPGFKVGLYIGLGLYTLYCIGRIIDPEITIEVYTDGSNKVLSERGRGIMGIIVVITSFLLSIFG